MVDVDGGVGPLNLLARCGDVGYTGGVVVYHEDSYVGWCTTRPGDDCLSAGETRGV